MTSGTCIAPLLQRERDKGCWSLLLAQGALRLGWFGGHLGRKFWKVVLCEQLLDF